MCVLLAWMAREHVAATDYALVFERGEVAFGSVI